jgi:SAM-dependent methyltransferase
MSQKNILDYGCGTGLALKWLTLHARPGRTVGLDVSEGAIRFARRQYPEIEFRVMNIEAPPEDLRQEFDVALCVEVLEHLQAPNRALEFLVNHYLKPNGVLVSSTPNRMVFSAGTEPSPINRTHIHEMDFAEFSGLLGRYFEETKIWGMRFREPTRRQAYARMVQHASDGMLRFGEWWWNPTISRLYRWIARGEIWRLVRGEQYYRWQAQDFEFVDKCDEISKTAIWFLAISSRPVPTKSRS